MKHKLILNSAVSLSLILGVSASYGATEVVEIKRSAVLTSGVAVSTSVSSRGNPQPILMHILDYGSLPQGWKSRLKGAAMLGSCYGDLSSGRAVCRIHSLSFVEPNGRTVEKQVEGWVIGADGTPGLRGKLLDRVGKERRAFITEILNDLKTDDVFKRGASQGTSDVLKKLSILGEKIKRVEEMSPVISVEAGRVVDVVFKKRSDLNPNQQKGNLTNDF